MHNFPHTSYPSGWYQIGWGGEFAPGSVARGALQGSYGGASAEVSAGLGLGANALIGGFNGSVALQPLSIQGQTGLNVAAGIAGVELQPVRIGRGGRIYPYQRRHRG